MARKPQIAKWSNEELVTKMHQAKAFEEPIVQEFLDMTESKLFEAWKNSPAGEINQREELYLQCLGIAAFRKFIEDTIVLGKMAESEMNAKLQAEQKRKGQ